ncbi:MAG: hypothetical protein RLY87_278, partial [Chloroflexota bacterium]
MIDSINGAVKRVLVRGLLFCMGLLLVVSTVLENGHAAVRIPPKSLQNNVAADLLKTQKTTPRTGLSEVHVFGDDPGQGNLTVPSGLEGAIAVGAGRQHYLVVKPDGSVETWGTGWNGQTSPPAGLTGVIEVAGGDTFSLALKNDGTVVAWGDMAHWTSATEYLTDTFDDAFVPAGLVDVAHIYAHSQLAIAL